MGISENAAYIKGLFEGYEIDKNTKALSDYFTQLGQENEGVLDYLQSGVSQRIKSLI